MSEYFDPDDPMFITPIDEDDEDLQARAEQAELSYAGAGVIPPDLPDRPLLQALFAQTVRTLDPTDSVLLDFADHVVGPLSDVFATKTAKGGNFYRDKAQSVGEKADRYGRDQTMRAHLLNGALPALRIVRLAVRWGAKIGREWSEAAERLLLAGYVLHDYTKLEEVKESLEKAKFSDMEAISEQQVSTLETIFAEWCDKLGLDKFLAPIGDVAEFTQALIYIAHNTQVRSNTAHSPHLLPKIARSDYEVLDAIALASRLADLIAYVAATPRKLVAGAEAKSLRQVVEELSQDRDRRPVARFAYHHVAENRGLLLNFIHESAVEALSVEDQRVPLLFAPSGVVYLERVTAPPLPNPADLTSQIVTRIRHKTREKLIQTGKLFKLGNTELQADDSHANFFDLRHMATATAKLVERYVKTNKMEKRLKKVVDGRLPGADNMPTYSADPKDARADQIAEWATFLDRQCEKRLPSFDFAAWVMPKLGVDDLTETFQSLKNNKVASSGGLKPWWFWVAGHALNRRRGQSDTQTLEWLTKLGAELAAELPVELPKKAQVAEESWEALTDYLNRVFTVGGVSAETYRVPNELNRYMKGKAGGAGKAICALCGSEYKTTTPAETAVAFQPGVYTARIKIGAGSNARNLCALCALEQVLRQAFMENVDKGSRAEGQLPRYLSLYPTYYFTPESLRFVQTVYNTIKDIRISDKGLMRALREGDLTDPALWQRLEAFMLRQPTDSGPSKRLLRYSPDLQPTFFMFGIRGLKDPSDTESWIVPTFLALLLPILIDVKVVVSEGAIPLMLEADEMYETVWFDGGHSSIRDVIRAFRKDDKGLWHENATGRLNADEVFPALQRLAAAYLIHLETEYAPPKEHWQRFGPIAHSLMESPLYVFHYLMKQERDGKKISTEQVHRYVTYAQDLFNPKGDHPLMSLAQRLVTAYRGFYRAETIRNSNSILRPLSVISDALLIADQRLFHDPESLTEAAFGELAKFMDRVGKGQADGRFPKGISVLERETAMREFCKLFVEEVFVGIFNRDVAALRGKQLNLLKNACEALYRDMQRQEWIDRGIRAATDEAAEAADTAESTQS